MRYTVLILEGQQPKYCVGVCNTYDEAVEWAVSGGLIVGQTCLILKLYP